MLGSAGTHPSSSQLHPRGLNDSGRQSSLDSGIGTAAGSQSSYSGSFSSYTGSLDTASQGGGEEFGSVASLPAPPSLPPSIPPPTPPPLPALTPEHSSSTSTPCPPASRFSSCASRRHSEEYHVPSLLRLQYDTPRGLFQAPSMREPSTQQGPQELCRGSRGSADGGGSQGQRLSNNPTGPRAQHQATMQRSLSWGSEKAHSVDSDGPATPRPMQPSGGFGWEETKVSAVSHALNTSINRPSNQAEHSSIIK